MRVMFTFIFLSSFSFSNLYATNVWVDEVSQNYFATKIQKASELCEAYVCYQESFLEKRAELIPSEVLATIKKSINFMEPFQNKLKKISSKQQAIPFLKVLLEARFKFLDSRHSLIKKFREEVATKESTHMLVGITHPDRFDQQPKNFQLFSQASTDNYQMINQLILHLWELIDPQDLPANIKLLVRCSYMLWDNLTKKRSYLGHPDECIITYDEETDTHKKDWELWNLYLKEHDVDIELLNWRHKKTKIYETCYIRSTYDSNSSYYEKIPELSYPEWLKKTETHIESTLSTTKSKKNEEKSFLPSQLIQSQKSDHKNKILLSKKDVMNTEPLNSKLGKNFLKKESIFDLNSYTGPSQENLKETFKLALIEKPILSTSVEENDILENKSEDSILLEKSIETKTVDDKETKLEEATVEEILDLEPWKTFKKVPKVEITPDVSTKKVLPFETISKSDQDLIEKIFNTKGFNSVTFGEFKSLWARIHGRKSIQETTGSSHKVLIASDGRKFPIFAHGDGMGYTKRTIKFLRDALTETGYYNPLD